MVTLLASILSQPHVSPAFRATLRSDRYRRIERRCERARERVERLSHSIDWQPHELRLAQRWSLRWSAALYLEGRRWGVL